MTPNYINNRHQLPLNKADHKKTPFVLLKTLSETKSDILDEKYQNRIRYSSCCQALTQSNLAMPKSFNKCAQQQSSKNSSKLSCTTEFEGNCEKSPENAIKKDETAKNNSKYRENDMIIDSPFLEIRTVSNSGLNDNCASNGIEISPPEVTIIDGVKFVCHDLQDNSNDLDINFLLNKYVGYSATSCDDTFINSSPKKTDDINKIKGMGNKSRFKEGYEECFIMDCNSTSAIDKNKKVIPYVYGATSSSDKTVLMDDPFNLMTGVQFHEVEDAFIKLSSCGIDNCIQKSQSLAVISESAALLAVNAVVNRKKCHKFKNPFCSLDFIPQNISSSKDVKLRNPFPVISQKEAIEALKAFTKFTVSKMRKMSSATPNVNNIVSVVRSTKTGRISKVPARFRDNNFDVDLICMTKKDESQMPSHATNVRNYENLKKKKSTGKVHKRNSEDLPNKSSGKVHRANYNDLKNSVKEHKGNIETADFKLKPEISKKIACSCKTDVHFCQCVENIENNAKLSENKIDFISSDSLIGKDFVSIDCPEVSASKNLNQRTYIKNIDLNTNHMWLHQRDQNLKCNSLNNAFSQANDRDIKSDSKIFEDGRPFKRKTYGKKTKVKCQSAMVDDRKTLVHENCTQRLNSKMKIQNMIEENDEKFQEFLLHSNDTQNLSDACESCPSVDNLTDLSSALTVGYEIRGMKPNSKILEINETTQKSTVIHDSDLQCLSNDSESSSADSLPGSTLSRSMMKAKLEQKRRGCILTLTNDLAKIIKVKNISCINVTKEAVKQIQGVQFKEKELQKKRIQLEMKNAVLKEKLNAVLKEKLKDINSRISVDGVKEDDMCKNSQQSQHVNSGQCKNSTIETTFSEMMTKKNLLSTRLAVQMKNLKQQKAALDLGKLDGVMNSAYKSSSSPKDITVSRKRTKSSSSSDCTDISIKSTDKQYNSVVDFSSVICKKADRLSDVEDKVEQPNPSRSKNDIKSALKFVRNVKDGTIASYFQNNSKFSNCNHPEPSNRTSFKQSGKTKKSSSQVSNGFKLGSEQHMLNIKNIQRSKNTNNKLGIIPVFPSQPLQNCSNKNEIIPKIIQCKSISEEEFLNCG